MIYSVDWFVYSLFFSLRQYYLVQVQWVDRRDCPLSRAIFQLPRTKSYTSLSILILLERFSIFL